ncbi:MAG: BMP family ABC transporter substrate-binding protein [Alphaproteobacteria bacterium]
MKRMGSAAALAAAVSVSAAAAAEPLKVGFVYLGPISDHGWTYQHEQGRLAVEAHFGAAVETTYVENVADGADSERVIRNLAAGGYDIVFATSFGYMNGALAVAEAYPGVVIEHATGYKRAANMGTYMAASHEGRYVAGFVAGHVTETGLVGYIASFPIPEVIRDINAVMLGLQASNPDARLQVIWLNTWFDPGKEREAADALIAQGVDVLMQHTDSAAPMQAAEEAGVHAIGYASDMSQFGPHAHLLSVINNWAPFYVDVVQDVMDGTWQSQDFWGGISDDVVAVRGLNEALPADVRAEAEAIVASMADDSFHPFTGPLYDQRGAERVAAGHVMSDAELAAMDWFVRGIEQPLP